MFVAVPSQRTSAQQCTDFWCQFTSAVGSAYSEATSYYNSYTSQGYSYYTSATGAAGSYYSSLTSAGYSYYTSITSQGNSYYQSFVSQYGTDTAALSVWASQVQQAASTNLQLAVQMAESSSGPYSVSAWNIISDEAEGEFLANYSSAQQTAILTSRQPILTEGTILAMRLVPIYNSTTGQLVPFDTVARRWVAAEPAIAGSDLGKDPIATATLMVLNSNYIEYAPIIQGPDDNWISMRQAMAIGYRTDEVQKASTDFASARQAYTEANSQQMETGVEAFSNDIQTLNTPQPWLSDSLIYTIALVILVVGIVAGLFLRRSAGAPRRTPKETPVSAGPTSPSVQTPSSA